MSFDASSHHRRSIRLKDYDYSQAGVYFVTFVAQNREELFGAIRAGVMSCNAAGEILQRHWGILEERFPNVVLDEFIVMPNHCHGILWITEDFGQARDGSAGTTDVAITDVIQRRRMLLPKVVGYFKMNTAKQINLLRDTPGLTVWLRNYWEHVIRSERELERIRDYIRTNPLNWETDRERGM